MWRRTVKWLNQVAVDDPVDRRNAPFFQVLMVMMGCLIPLNWAYLKLTVGFPSAPGFAIDRALSLVVAAAAWGCFFLTRHNRFRAAVKWFLIAEVVTQLIAYAATGLRVQLSDPTTSVLIVVLAGLMLGRRTLWIMFGLLLAMFAVGVVTDVLRVVDAGGHWRMAVNYTPSIVVRYFIIIVVIDRCLVALRESLDESISRGQALTRANQRLLHEMGERERAQQQLVHAQKMEAVGRLAGGIAHDFNHVLSVILGYAGQRERLAGDRGALQRAMEGIETAARRGAAVCRKLLGFSRQDVAHAEVFDAAQALRELAPMLQQLFDAPVRVSVEAGEQAAPIRFDRGQFDLMVLNIAANARDAMPAGGHFEVGVSVQSDGSVGIDLRDDGAGMPAQVKQRAFEPFFTTKPADKGTGLGLAVVHDLLAQAGGSIDVDSEPGQGACFRIHLPAVPEATSSRAA